MPEAFFALAIASPNWRKNRKKKNDCYAGYYSWAKIIGGIYEKKKKLDQLASKKGRSSLFKNKTAFWTERREYMCG